ncbi:MAG: FG-GAP repeat domain-containing protein, partial [Gaiellaceae bacterium]
AGGFSEAPGSPVAVRSFPIFVAATELNGDGKVDLAVINHASHNVSILLGNGTGGFAPALGSPVAVGIYPIALVAVDLNGDGKRDLAVANNESDTVSILLGDGAGGFSAAPGSPVAAGDGAGSLAATDVNGDGRPDLAVANFESGTVSILLGNGAGGFSEAPGSPILVGTAPNAIAAADLNGDDRPDLATANSGSDDLTILLGNGAGGFTPSIGSPVDAGDGSDSLAVADLNGDGKPDLAVANANSDDVSILLGNGRGGFTAATPVALAAGDLPIAVAARDLNGDGRPDLAVVNLGSDSVAILLNGSGPTMVALRSFSARSSRQGVELRWRTGAEAMLLGFDVYRAGVRLNRPLIAARGEAGGAGYRLLDRGARVGATYLYRLQAVRLDGTRAWIAKATTKR